MADVLRIEGQVLTGPGKDDVREGAWVLGGKVTFEEPTGDNDVTTLAGWAMPGLVDAHCHVGLAAGGAVDTETTERQAITDRDAGTLLIRDAGSPAETRWIDDREDLPKIIRAGRHIARTRRYIRNFANEIEPEDLVAQVRIQARRGDGWVKLVGDWIDRGTADLAPSWPGDAVRDAIAAAHQEGARVTAHCFGEECLPDLLAAGIDGIEHGTGLTAETTALAAAQQVAVVPTLINIRRFPEIVEPARGKFDTYVSHMLSLHERRYDTIRTAFEAGVPIYAGTDAGGSLPHGLIASEVAELVAAGLTPTQALDAACWASRAWLGRPALAEGEDADLVVYPSDPRADVGVLAHPTAVVLRGRTVDRPA